MKYVLSYNTKFGAVSIESKDPEELAIAYEDLKSVAKALEFRHLSKAKKIVQPTKTNSGRRGKGETAKILSEIEGKLLSTNFFSKPKTTGEVKQKLTSVSRRSFTSRKVSQALGILWQKRALRRIGKRNYFAYSK